MMGLGGEALDPALAAGDGLEPDPQDGGLAVFRNRSFLRLWLSQAATQIGGRGRWNAGGLRWACTW